MSDETSEVERLRSENAKLKNAISKLNREILDGGLWPKVHEYFLQKHRSELPQLWARVDELLELSKEMERVRP